MPDINWGGDETTAPFSSRLDETAGNFILAEDNDGSTVLLEYDGSTWQYRGPVEMNGEDISGVGTLTATDATVSGTVDAGTVSTDDSVTVTTGEASGTLHYGSNQDRANAGDSSVALGIGARANGDDGAGGTIGSHVAVGYLAAQSNTGDRVTAAGREAAQNNTGARVTAAGREAAQSNTGDRVTASGYQAARGDGLADPTTMGDDNIGIGESAIRNNQASGVIAIGQEAGINAQTDDQLIITQRDGTRRMVMDLTTGDLSITGSLSENATL